MKKALIWIPVLPQNFLFMTGWLSKIVQRYADFKKILWIIILFFYLVEKNLKYRSNRVRKRSLETLRWCYYKHCFCWNITQFDYRVDICQKIVFFIHTQHTFIQQFCMLVIFIGGICRFRSFVVIAIAYSK